MNDREGVSVVHLCILSGAELLKKHVFLLKLFITKARGSYVYASYLVVNTVHKVMKP